MRSTLLGLGFAAWVLGACNGLRSQADCVEAEACEPADGGRVDGNGGPDVVPAGCDPTKPPKESPACVTDDFGVFVSPAGKDGAPGTKADPVRSIAEAVNKGKRRVYVCDGAYEVAVELTAPVAIFGGLTCGWVASDTSRPKLAPPRGPALRVTKVNGAVSVEDLDIVGSADPNTPGDSAIAAFVSESTTVTFRRVNFTAGAGTGGSKGASKFNYTGATATAGGATNTTAAGAGPSCTCGDGSTSKGGSGAAGSGAGIGDGAATPAVGVPNAGTSGTNTCTDGQPGSNGLATLGGTAAGAAGALGAQRWDSSATGLKGGNGNPGQGGGGGGAKSTLNIGGGGGSCGGCGGAGGDPGTNGGSSIALLSFNSTVTVDGGTLVSGGAGAGGAGGDGQDGQSGGALGAGACNGGSGASGAGGSGGGGGAGGHSVPVAFVGTDPRVLGAPLTPGTKGAVGSGGKAGAGAGNAGNSGTPGPEGKAQEKLAL